MQCSSNFATACRYYLPSPGDTAEPGSELAGDTQLQMAGYSNKAPQPSASKKGEGDEV